MVATSAMPPGLPIKINNADTGDLTIRMPLQGEPRRLTQMITALLDNTIAHPARRRHQDDRYRKR
ncbi:hypothetical protein [Actinoplanes sp. NPDC020271]|uniref:hypothetical protein n=1 Tax=Actinoplanes sp. NPDC020271 TaxID=3363896 RepID=UPI0037B2FC26